MRDNDVYAFTGIYNNWTYTYDLDNRRVKAVSGSTTVNLTYDPLGRLLQTDKGTTATTTKFAYLGDAMVLEYDGNNAILNRYVHGANTRADDPLVWYSGAGLTAKSWLHADHLGSVVAVASAAGGVSVNTYDEYGNPVYNGGNQSTNTGRFQYTGQAWIPELNLYYYKARFYSPSLGRFMQTDPIGYQGGENLYDYVGDDPTDREDPTGLYVTNCDAADTTCKKSAVEFEKQRQVNLQSKDPDIVASAQVYGDSGTANGVSVNFLDDKAMNTKYSEDTKGNTGAHFDNDKTTASVDIRGSLRGREMRETTAHEGTHVVQDKKLGATYNSDTGKFSSSANMTRMDSERQAYSVGNKISHQFHSPKDIDRWIVTHYTNLGETILPHTCGCTE